MDVLVTLKLFGGIVLTVVTGLANFLLAHKEIVSAIVLRIEKDTADGTWSNEEKEQMAIDIYNNQIAPRLPFQLKVFLMFVPKSVIENTIKKMITKICKKTKNLQSIKK